MKHSVQQDAEYFAKVRRRKNRWHKVVICLAAVVVFCTTYALILPAITMERESCDIPEHTHSLECYTQTTASAERVPICTVESLGIHTHTAGCYDAGGNLICGYTDFAVHQHDAFCYGADGNLWCPLPEIEAHTHDAGCYAVPETVAVHSHTEDCCTLERGELICQEEEAEGHQHSEDCYGEAGDLICGQEESTGHQHDENCYAWNEVLTCQLPTEPAELEPELICGKEEIILHEHLQECFDQYGNLICGKTEVLSHQHTDACFASGAVSADTLTCTLPEDENHTHTALCYGTWILTCGMEEHTHTEECQGASALTEEEQAQVDAVIALMEKLPTAGEARERLNACDKTVDPLGYNACLEALQNQVVQAGDAYQALNKGLRSCVTNLEKFEELEWLLVESALGAAPGLTSDSAYVSELTVTGAEVTASEETVEDVPEDSESGLSGVITVRSGETLTYRFLARTESYTGERFGEGRVRLEFVLPLLEEQASFDLNAMTWLDGSNGYEPEIRTEMRLADDREIQCQVLTAYILLSSEEPQGVIPGEFTAEVPVTVLDISPGENIVLEISAAMEYGTWEGACETHQTEEKLTVSTGKYPVTVVLSARKQQEIYEGFLAEVLELEELTSEELEEQAWDDATDLLVRLREAFQQGLLTEEDFTELYDRVYALMYGDLDTIAERAEGSNWMRLRSSGWFEAFSGSTASPSYARRSAAAAYAAALSDAGDGATDQHPSDVQVTDRGGTNTSVDGSVSVSKTISGTDLENVFDITLQVQTSMNVSEICQEPDMAVVIVMDISNTMNSNFGGVTRYAAAMDAADDFLDQFAANNSLGISKVGYVAFNTDAHQIFSLQACATQEQADALKNTMRTQTGNIINASDYNASHSRFTNVEAGLAMAADMLNGVSNENKFIIFLSDGFPTTYISSGYSGYDPYDSSGRFYDHVLNKPCLYGTSYSDEAAIRARKKAAAIKNSGATIFSIGVDVAGQTIQKYITQSEGANGFSVVDRTGTTYEIGAANSTEAYKNWLRNSIGSGYYYDSTDSAGLYDAYNQIFAEIKHQVEAGAAADWVAEDPLPTVGGSTELVEFIGFYNKTPELVFTDLTGSYTVNGENTAAFDGNKSTINWDLKQSGYQETASGSTTTYTYTLVYRVRLKNENGVFTEGAIYPTNDTTTLQYRTIEGTDGNLTVSDPKSIDFPIPSVHGYLAELTFQKVDSVGQALTGAEFTLSHDTEHCGFCRGDGASSVTIADQVATSDENGTVSFMNIPSGHQYTLTETKIPDGCSANGNTYQVKVAYDALTVTVTDLDGKEVQWDETIENYIYYELPKTGGAGTIPYFLGGIALMAFTLTYSIFRRRREAHSA